MCHCVTDVRKRRRPRQRERERERESGKNRTETGRARIRVVEQATGKTRRGSGRVGEAMSAGWKSTSAERKRERSKGVIGSVSRVVNKERQV